MHLSIVLQYNSDDGVDLLKIGGLDWVLKNPQCSQSEWVYKFDAHLRLLKNLQQSDKNQAHPHLILFRHFYAYIGSVDVKLHAEDVRYHGIEF